MDYPEREGGKPKVNAAWDAIGEVKMAYGLKAYSLEGMDTLHYSRPFAGGALKVKDALHLLTLAGLVTPVKQTDGTGVPLYALSNLRHTPEDYRNMISKETMELEKR